MAKTKKDGKAAAAGDDVMDDAAPAPVEQGVFDGPMSDEDAIAQLIELNHERNECASRWDDAKTKAADAKKDLDNASNAISLLIDRIDRQRTGTDQPVLRTLEDAADTLQ